MTNEIITMSKLFGITPKEAADLLVDQAIRKVEMEKRAVEYFTK